jgi:hypothetical protein
MKVRDVPQDPGSSLPHGITMYAVDDQGRYQGVFSVGNEAADFCLQMTWEYIDEQIAVTAERVRAGTVSPLAFFMQRKFVDHKLLAKYVGMARWRIKRHLKPSVFRKLKPPILRTYADFFGVTVEEFISPSLDTHSLLLDKKES